MNHPNIMIYNFFTIQKVHGVKAISSDNSKQTAHGLKINIY